jgi:branched-chain amino acid transport system permease protein
VSAAGPAAPVMSLRQRPPRGAVGALVAWAGSRRLHNSWPAVAIAAAVLALLAVQAGLAGGTQRVLTSVFMFVALAQAWNLIGGFTGYASFGQVAFVGIGAYTAAVLMSVYHVSFWPALVVAILVGTAFAVVVGLPLLRLRGHYFAIATLGVAQGMQEVVNNLGITGGGAAITIPAFGSDAPTRFPGNSAFYVYFLLLAAITLAVCLVVSRSRLGYAMRAVHQDEDAAGALGVNTTWIKVFAFALSAAICAAAGAFEGFQLISFYPDTVFSADITVLMVIMVVIGGSGSIVGPLVGAVGLELLDRFLLANVPGYSLLILGAAIVAVVVFFPQGVVPFFRDAVSSRHLSLLDNIRKHRL